MDKKDKKEITIDNLAIIVAEGFNGVNRRIDGLDGRMGGLEGRMGKLESRMDKLESEMSGLRSSVNNYLRLSDERYLELKAREKVIVSWVKTIADKTGVKIDFQELEKSG